MSLKFSYKSDTIIIDNSLIVRMKGMRDMEEIRLNKYLSDCGIMSRRAAEREIESGAITVNGERVEVGRKILPGRDRVMYKGKEIKKTSDRKVYVMLYKPRGYVTTMDDEQGRKCIPELVSDVPARVYPCGRLDMDSEGLLLLTNDGAVAQKLMHPRNHVEKIYHVKVKGEIEPEKLRALNSPMKLDGEEIAPVKVSIISRKDGETALKFILTEGRNRQIRRMCEQVELEIKRLKRIAIGEINIGMLKPGKWKYLNHNEAEYLKSLI